MVEGPGSAALNVNRAGPTRQRPEQRPVRRRWLRIGIAIAAAAALLVSVAGCGAFTAPQRASVSLILKTLTNPYFVSMEQSATSEAKKLGVQLHIAAGTADGDTQTQIDAIYTAIARGDKGILITANGPSVNAALLQARAAGLYVIALDTPLVPASTANNSYATDNSKAGELIGRYTASKLAGKDATIAMVDLQADQVVSVDVLRDHGFLTGMGIDPGTKNLNGQEKRTGKFKGGGNYKVVCHQPSTGAEDGGRTAMEQCLQTDPNINVAYAANEASAMGAAAAIKAAGKSKQIMLVTIDGSCGGMKLVGNGTFAADALQYPGKMASLGVQAVDKRAAGKKPPTVSPGKNFLDTGTALVAKDAPNNVTPQQNPDQASKVCWG